MGECHLAPEEGEVLDLLTNLIHAYEAGEGPPHG